jgi:Activator of Hsp90 ATPase homolog 1-like protein
VIPLGNVVRFDPPKSLWYTWFPGSPDKPTLVQVSFQDEKDHILVTVTHSEGESGPSDGWGRRAEQFIRSWETVLPAFASYAASAASAPAPEARGSNGGPDRIGKGKEES